MTKKIEDTLNLENETILKSYSNPIKTWQKDYDSVSIYQHIY